MIIPIGTIPSYTSIHNYHIKHCIPPTCFPYLHGARWPSGLELWTGERVVLCSNPAAATSLRNFGNSVYPALPVSFGGDTKSRRSLLSGVYARGSKISHQSALEICNLSWIPHSSIGKDNSLSHSCVSPKMGCLECT